MEYYHVKNNLKVMKPHGAVVNIRYTLKNEKKLSPQLHFTKDEFIE